MATKNAPSVSYPVGRSSFYGGMLFFLWIIGWVTIGVWIVAVGSSDAAWWQNWRVWSTIVLLGASGGGGAWHWWHSPQGALRWTGQAWVWRMDVVAPLAEECEVAVRVCIDLQWQIFLCLSSKKHFALWVWVSRNQSSVRWADFRRALYAQ